MGREGDGSRCDAGLEQSPLGRQAVGDGGPGRAVAVAAETVGALRIDGDQEDMGAVGSAAQKEARGPGDQEDAASGQEESQSPAS